MNIENFFKGKIKIPLFDEVIANGARKLQNELTKPPGSLGKLERNVRAHGNFSEYVPLFLILLMIIETKLKISFNYLLIICIVFLYGRLAHAICFSFYKHNPFLRISGMICTYFPLLVFSIILLMSFLN